LVFFVGGGGIGTDSLLIVVGMYEWGVCACWSKPQVQTSFWISLVLLLTALFFLLTWGDICFFE
jgi:hypothetical protein